MEITRFDISRYQNTPTDPEFTQAGAHPNVNIYMQFCGDEGIPIENVQVIPDGQPNAGNLLVTTTVAHGHANTSRKVRVIGVEGIWSANADWFVFTVPTDRQLVLSGSRFIPEVDTTYVPGTGELFIPANEYGCDTIQRSAFLRSNSTCSAAT